jgi:cell division protein FtsN
MAKDYARYTVKSKKRLTEKGWYHRLLLIIFLLCLVSAMLLGWYAVKNKRLDFSKKNLIDWVTQMKTLLSHKKVMSLPFTKTKPIKSAKQELEVQFDFYTELPKMQVTLPETEKIASKPLIMEYSSTKDPRKKDLSNEHNEGQYVLQMGIFKSEPAARQMQISLLLTGFDAQIVKSMAANHAFYRIQQGPYPTIARAKIIQQQLQNKGIVSLVKKIN